ncbi:hypothetical protein CEXT_133941 [Caerostris extrusa]|uniref:Uncharacterized protein n=1 Tax=Caerostris extrusa TaxID=172846 RepID=A0AAV4SQQ1_CAEEX|nr:hypothetical protein CEXT_133941 [Caerostris extrusa]
MPITSVFVISQTPHPQPPLLSKLSLFYRQGERSDGSLLNCNKSPLPEKCQKYLSIPPSPKDSSLKSSAARLHLCSTDKVTSHLWWPYLPLPGQFANERPIIRVD